MASWRATLSLAVSSLAIATCGQSAAATLTNRDAVPQLVKVTTAIGKIDVVVRAGETLELCPQGCFMTFPNGDKEALSGGETIEILDGVGRIQD
jgi:hypothetical protein